MIWRYRERINGKGNASQKSKQTEPSGSISRDQITPPPFSRCSATSAKSAAWRQGQHVSIYPHSLSIQMISCTLNAIISINHMLTGYFPSFGTCSKFLRHV